MRNGAWSYCIVLSTASIDGVEFECPVIPKKAKTLTRDCRRIKLSWVITVYDTKASKQIYMLIGKATTMAAYVHSSPLS